MFFRSAAKRQVLFFGFALLAGWLSVASATLADEPELTRGPYLQSVTPESIVIVWRTNSQVAPSVRIGKSVAALNRQIVGDSIQLLVSADVEAAKYIPRLYQEPEADAAQRDADDEDPSTAPGTYQYEAHVEGLEPATRYFYSVYAGKQLLAGADKNHYFETSPAHGTDADLRIWVVGDSGTGGHDQKEVHLAMQEFTKESKRDLDLYLHVGDMAYHDGTDVQFQNNFFDIYQTTLRNKVCWPSMGNHEGHTSRGLSGFGPYYDAYVVPTAAEAGGVPSGTEAYYSFDIADVHFVCLDSHDLDRTPDGAMAQWLIADLEETRQEWLIAFWHHPPYTKGSHDSDAERQLIEMRTHFMPILESYGVDIVLSGHSHIYERSMLIDGAYATPTIAEGVVVDDRDGNPDHPYRKSQGLNPNEGTVAIVAGHGGAGLTRRGTMPIMREIIVEHGSVILDIRGDTLIGTMVNKNNVERDVFSIVKRDKVEVAHLENPRQPPSDPSLLTVFVLAWKDETVGQLPKNWSLVQGSSEAVLVEQAAGGKKKQLAVKAGEETVIATYDNFDDLMSELRTEISLSSDPAAVAGVVFAYQDEKNYYTYRFNTETSTAEFLRYQNGEPQVLDTRKVEIDFSKKVEVEIEIRDQRFEFQLNNQVEYQVSVDQPLPEGKFGALVGENSSASYQYLAIRRGNL